MTTYPCECEHASHFDKNCLSPDGNPGHRYGAKFVARYVTVVKTSCGPYRVCRDCADDCNRYPTRMAVIPWQDGDESDPPE